MEYSKIYRTLFETKVSNNINVINKIVLHPKFGWLINDLHRPSQNMTIPNVLFFVLSLTTFPRNEIWIPFLFD